MAPKPQTVDHVHAAAVPRAGLTAWQALFDHGKLAKEQTVVIHGASTLYRRIRWSPALAEAPRVVVMLSWWHRDVIAADKLPLMLSFVSFVVTFVSTRAITRLIRDGRGPFRNVTAGGTHIHHSVPGIILLIIGAFTAVGGPGTMAWLSFSAIAVGIGTSLVLDEFALILHLQDVYWSGEGQLSVEAVSLVAACLGLALVGFSPVRVANLDSAEFSLRISATGVLVIDGCLALACVLKGKYRSGLFGLFLPPVGFIGAVRLARPNSIWARRLYRGKKLEHATRRAAAFDRRWKPVQADWEDFIGGRPSQPDTPPVPAPEASRTAGGGAAEDPRPPRGADGRRGSV